MSKAIRTHLIFAILVIGQVQCCSHFFNPETRTLHIPMNETCTFEESLTETVEYFEEITIDGTLTFYRSARAHLKYKKLLFGQNGLLQIGQQVNQFNYSVTFEDLSEGECILSEPINGSFDILSFQFDQIPLQKSVFGGEKTIHINPQFADFNSIQKIILVDPNLSNYWESHTVRTVRNNTITTQDYLSKNFLLVPQELNFNSNPFILSASSYGVTFKNACLLGGTKNMIGVNFQNVRGLKLKGGSMNGCHFHDSDYSSKTSRNMELQMNVYDSVFLSLSGIQVHQGEDKEFEGNLIMSLSNSNLTLGNTFKNNRFINSNVMLHLDRFKKYDFQGIQLYSSEAHVINPKKAVITLNNCVLVKFSRIQFQNELFEFHILNSFIFDSPFDLSATFVKKLVVEDSFVYNEREQDQFLLHSDLIHEESSQNVLDESNMDKGKLGEDKQGEDRLGEDKHDESNLSVNNLGENNLGEKKPGEKKLGESILGVNDLGEKKLGEKKLGESNLGVNDLGEKRLGESNLGVNDLGENNLGEKKLDKSNLTERKLEEINLSESNLGVNNHLGESNLGANNLGESNFGVNNLGQRNLGVNKLGEQKLGESNLSKDKLGETKLSESNDGENKLGDNKLSKSNLGVTELGENELGENEVDKTKKHQTVFIYLKKNKFMGYYNSIFTTRDTREDNPVVNGPVKKKRFVLRLNYNEFSKIQMNTLVGQNFRKNTVAEILQIFSTSRAEIRLSLCFPLFNLPAMDMQILDSQLPQAHLVQLEAYNESNSELIIPSPSFCFQSNLYWSKEKPHYYYLTNMTFAEGLDKNFTTKLVTNSGEQFTIGSAPFIQILKQKVHHIHFISEADIKLNIQTFNFHIAETPFSLLSEDTRHYTVIIQLPDIAIQQVKIHKYTDPEILTDVETAAQQVSSEFHVQSFDGVVFVKPPMRNILKIVWTRVKTPRVYKIELQLCQKGKYLDSQGNCNDTCSSLLIGPLCLQTNCGSGYFTDSSENQCKQCPYGCAECDNHMKCHVCYKDFILSQGKCLDTCPQGTFKHEHTCAQCLRGCQNCVDQWDCLSCYDGDRDFRCNKCPQGKYLDNRTCLPCHKTCKLCYSGDRHSCTECATQYFKYLGQCIPYDA